MFAPSLFRRTLLTTARSANTATHFSTTSLNVYRPILTSRFFSQTSKMGKEGVHNLAS
jgi:thioredoxin 1